MKNYKVGDRVKIYGCIFRSSDESLHHITVDGLTGEIKEICLSGYITVKTNFDETFLAHPKQCRKLVKKERRRIWVSPDYEFLGPDNTSLIPKEGWLEFVEVKKKVTDS